MNLKSEKIALVIVDVQMDFLPGGALAVEDGDQIIPVINDLQIGYGLVVATQDWHPKGHSSFASQHEGKMVYEIIDWEGMPQVLWPDHCVQGSIGASLSPVLDSRAIEAIFRKGMDVDIDSYSGFYDNGRRRNTGLYGYLKDRGVSEVHVCGLAADYCVYYTAMDALTLGFDTKIVQAATKAIDQQNFERLCEEFIKQRGQLI